MPAIWRDCKFISGAAGEWDTGSARVSILRIRDRVGACANSTFLNRRASIAVNRSCRGRAGIFAGRLRVAVGRCCAEYPSRLRRAQRGPAGDGISMTQPGRLFGNHLGEAFAVLAECDVLGVEIAKYEDAGPMGAKIGRTRCCRRSAPLIIAHSVALSGVPPASHGEALRGGGRGTTALSPARRPRTASHRPEALGEANRIHR